MHDPIHFEIQREIDDLDRIIKNVSDLPVDENIQQNERKKLEQSVCIQSRSLFSRFVDVALWSGVDETTITNVRNALTRARGCLTPDSPYFESVDRRLRDFEDFLVKESSKTAHG